MAVNKRLAAINTIVSYTRTILNVGVSLFTVRWIMAALGAQDYGLYVLIGGLVSCLAFINMALQASSSRYFSCAMDCGRNEVRQWFSTSFYLHLACSLFVALISIPTYYIAFKWVFSIPAERQVACQIVYWVSVFSTCVAILNAPFSAIFTAKQHIFELTLLQIATSFSLFSLAYCLLHVHGDRLVFYAVAVCGINITVYAIQVLRCIFKFDEARLVQFSMLTAARFKAMSSFSVWSLLDAISFMLRGQGLQILFNRYGITALNASYGVANQLSSQTNILSGAVVAALSPGIMAQYGAGDKEGAGVWCVRVCKVATLLALAVFVPLFAECPYVLDLWLVETPMACVKFVRVMAISYLITQFVTGGNMLIRARGNIGMYTRWTALCYLSAVIIALSLILLGVAVEETIYGFLISTTAYAIVTIMQACMQPGFSFREWFVHVFGSGIFLLAIGLFMASVIQFIFMPSLVRVGVIAVMNGFLLIVGAITLMFSRQERRLAFNSINSISRFLK